MRNSLRDVAILLAIAATMISVMPAESATPTNKRLRVHDNQRMLVNDQGQPVFLLADTAWYMCKALNRQDIEAH